MDITIIALFVWAALEAAFFLFYSLRYASKDKIGEFNFMLAYVTITYSVWMKGEAVSGAMTMLAQASRTTAQSPPSRVAVSTQGAAKLKC